MGRPQGWRKGLTRASRSSAAINRWQSKILQPGENKPRLGTHWLGEVLCRKSQVHTCETAPGVLCPVWAFPRQDRHGNTEVSPIAGHGDEWGARAHGIQGEPERTDQILRNFFTMGLVTHQHGCPERLWNLHPWRYLNHN